MYPFLWFNIKHVTVRIGLFSHQRGLLCRKCFVNKGELTGLEDEFKDEEKKIEEKRQKSREIKGAEEVDVKEHCQQSQHVKSNQITFIVTSPQHKCLGEWNSWERAPDSAKNNNLHMDSTYLQTVQKTMCKNTHTYTQYTQWTIKTYLVTNYTLYTVCTHLHYVQYLYIMYSIHSNMWRCNRLYIYSRLVEQQMVVQRCNRLFICSVVDVHRMVSSDSR